MSQDSAVPTPSLRVARFENTASGKWAKQHAVPVYEGNLVVRVAEIEVA